MRSFLVVACGALALGIEGCALLGGFDFSGYAPSPEEGGVARDGSGAADDGEPPADATRDAGSSEAASDASPIDAAGPDGAPNDAGQPGPDGPLEVSSGDASAGDVAVAEGEAGCAGRAFSFVPSGGIDPSDLDGCDLRAVTLDAPPAREAGAAGDDADDAPGGWSSDAADPADAGDLDPADTLLDVDTGAIVHAGAVLRPPTPADVIATGARDVQAGIAYRVDSYNVAVVTFGALTVPEGAVLKLVGAHAVALVASTAIRVDGVIEARPMGTDGVVCAVLPQSFGAVVPPLVAPGGFPGGAGGYNGRENGTTDATPGAGPGGGGAGDTLLIGGGGGGGHAAPGGSGALDVDGGVLSGRGGAAYDDPSLDVSSFHGGAGGGGGGGGVFAFGGRGGSGGGAVRLVAGDSIEIGGGAFYGGVDASGCGGGPGVEGDGLSSSGGGGAGGAVVVESPRVTLDAHASLLAAGGGAGDFEGRGAPSAQGQSLSLGTVGPASGCLVPSTAGDGSSSSGASGQNGNAPAPTGCAGGGAAGFIRLVAAAGNVAIQSGALLSPQAMPAFSIAALRLVE